MTTKATAKSPPSVEDELKVLYADYEDVVNKHAAAKARTKALKEIMQDRQHKLLHFVRSVKEGMPLFDGDGGGKEAEESDE